MSTTEERRELREAEAMAAEALRKAVLADPVNAAWIELVTARARRHYAAQQDAPLDEARGLRPNVPALEVGTLAAQVASIIAAEIADASKRIQVDPSSS